MSRRDVPSVEWVVMGAVVVGVTLLQWPFRLLMVSVADEGAVLLMAADVLRGRLPYIDGFHYALPGVFYLAAAAFALAGESIETARALAAVVFGVACGATYGIMRWWWGRNGALLVVLLLVAYRVGAYPHWQMVGYATLAMTVVLVATWMTGEAVRRGRAVGLFAAGMTAALAVLCKQDSGGAATLALGVFVLVGTAGGWGVRVRRACAFGAGGALVAVVFVGWLVSQGAVAETFHQTVRLPLQGARSFEYLQQPALWPLFGRDMQIRRHAFDYLPPLLLDLHFLGFLQSDLYHRTGIVDVLVKLVFWSPVFVAVVGVVAVGRGWRGAGDPAGVRALLLLVLLAVAMRAAFNPPHDWIHLMVLYPPTLLLAAALFAGPARRRRWLRAGLTAVVLGSFGTAAVLVAQARERLDTPLVTPRGTVWGTGPQVRSVAAVIEALGRRAAPEAPLAVFPYLPGINFLAGRPPLSRYYVVWPAHVDTGRDDEVRRALDADPQAPVVYSPSQFPGLPLFREFAPSIFGHLVRHYGIAEPVGGEPGGLSFLVLERRPLPAGEPLLGETLARARVWRATGTEEAQEVTGEARAEVVAEEAWPFLPVLQVAVVPGGRVAVRYAIRPEPGSRFETYYGIDPDRWQSDPEPEAGFRVVIRDAAGAHAVFADALATRRRPEDRGWKPVSIDLDPWAGRSVTLELEVAGTARRGRTVAVAGWGVAAAGAAPMTVRGTPLAWLIGVGLGAQLAVHLLEPPLPVTWGYAHLGRHAALPWVAALLVVLLPWAAARVAPALAARPLVSWRRWHVLLAALGLAALLAPLSLWWVDRPLSIDPPLFRLAVSRGEMNPRADFTFRLLALVTAPLSPRFHTWHVVLVLVAMLGAGTMLALVGCARRLSTTAGETLLIATVACSAFGVVRMSFGVTDEYPFAMAVMALFFWTALRTVDGDGHPVWPLVIGATGVFWYIGLVLQVPAALVLLGDEVRQPARRRRALVALLVAVGAAGLATVPACGRPFAFGAFFELVREESAYEYGLSATSSLLPFSYVMSAQHVWNVVNVWMLVDGVGILFTLTAGTWLGWRLLRDREWDVRAIMLGGTACGQLSYSFTLDTLFSPLQFWDLFSFATVATALFGGYAYVRWRRVHPGGGALAGLAAALAVVHLMARLGALHVDLDRHVAESPPTWAPSDVRPPAAPSVDRAG